jgi:adenine-specific DNA-methyltransferase
MAPEERAGDVALPADARQYRQDNIVSQRPPGDFPVAFEDQVYKPITGYWKTGVTGLRAAHPGWPDRTPRPDVKLCPFF